MKKYRQAVSALVLKSADVSTHDGSLSVDQILLVQKPRKNDVWQLPQGGIEVGETAGQAAVRELFEEAGLRLTDIAMKSAETYCYDFPPEFVERHHPVNDGQTLCFVVLRAPTDVVVTVDNVEVCGYTWVTASELGEYIQRQEYLSVIQKVLAEYQLQHKRA